MSQALLTNLSEVSARLKQAPNLHLFVELDALFESTAHGLAFPRIRAALRKLSRTDRASVTLFGGPNCVDLDARADIPGVIYAGNHGLDICGPGFDFVEPTAVAHREALHALESELVRRLQPVAGVRVENRVLTLGVHWHGVAPEDVQKVRDSVHAALANTNYPFVLTPSDAMFEIRPRVAWNKGAAVTWIREQLGTDNALPIYLGSHPTDEDAFHVLADGITIKIGPGASEARYHLTDPADAAVFLEWLVKSCSPQIGEKLQFLDEQG